MLQRQHAVRKHTRTRAHAHTGTQTQRGQNWCCADLGRWLSDGRFSLSLRPPRARRLTLPSPVPVPVPWLCLSARPPIWLCFLSSAPPTRPASVCTGGHFLCPIHAPVHCGGLCYSPSNYTCSSQKHKNKSTAQSSWTATRGLSQRPMGTALTAGRTANPSIRQSRAAAAALRLTSDPSPLARLCCGLTLCVCCFHSSATFRSSFHSVPADQRAGLRRRLLRARVLFVPERTAAAAGKCNTDRQWSAGAAAAAAAAAGTSTAALTR